MRNDFCSNYLEHSAKGTTWKKKAAKYISRVWKNGKWVYEYKITGKGYKKDANGYKFLSENASDIAKNYARSHRNSPINYKYTQSYNKAVNKAQGYGRKAAEAESNYHTKSLAGVTEKAIESGKKTISKILDSLKPETTVHITTSTMPARTEVEYKNGKRTVKKR